MGRICVGDDVYALSCAGQRYAIGFSQIGLTLFLKSNLIPNLEY